MTQTVSTIFGIYMLCAGLGIMINKGMTRDVLDHFKSNAALTFLSGVIMLIAGSALVMRHNIWSGWPDILVTILAWGAAIEGAIMLIYPKALFRFADWLLPNDKIIPVMAGLIMVLGVALIWL